MVLNRAELLLQAKNYAGSGAWLDESGNGHDAQLGSTSGSDTNDPLFKRYDGSQYLYLPGSSGNYLSTADVNLLNADTAHAYQSIGQWINAGGFSGGITHVDASDSRFGGKAVRAQITGAGTNRQISTAGSRVTGLSAATTYSFTVRVKNISFADGDCFLSISFRNSSDVFVNAVTGSAVEIPAGTYTDMTLTGVSGAAVDRAYMTVLMANGAVGEIIEVSGVCFRAGSDASFVPSLRIVGDLDMRATVAATDYTAAANQTLIHKAASNNGYSLQLTTGGELLGWHGDGTDYNPGTSSGASLSDGTEYDLRATMDVSSGTWTYYKDGTSFDTDVLGAVTPVADATVGLFVGAATSSTLLFAGDVKNAEVRDGIDGPVVARYDAADAVEPFATQTGSVDGRTWTYNRSASGLVSTVVDRDMFLLSTDDYMEIADDAALDFTGTEPFTLMALVRNNTVAAGQDVAVAKKADLTTAAGYALGRTTAASQVILADGTADDDDTAGTMVTHTLYTIAGRRSITDDNVEAFLDGTGSGSPTTDSTTATLANALPLRIGATSGTAANFWEGQIVAVALWREALSDADILQAGLDLIYGVTEPSTGRLLVLGLL